MEEISECFSFQAVEAVKPEQTLIFSLVDVLPKYLRQSEILSNNDVFFLLIITVF